GQVFVSMEFIDGVTLRSWLKERARSWREIVDAFVQAGRGLAAAHAADLVHRDFKPDNALVGKDGRVRVLDFGLARAMEKIPAGPSPLALEPTAVDSGRGALSTPLTRTGTFLGTPAYMAPEQLLGGGPGDARSDQFSFCVALYEGLYGERPFVA